MYVHESTEIALNQLHEALLYDNHRCRLSMLTFVAITIGTGESVVRLKMKQSLYIKFCHQPLSSRMILGLVKSRHMLKKSKFRFNIEGWKSIEKKCWSNYCSEIGQCWLTDRIDSLDVATGERVACGAVDVTLLILSKSLQSGMLLVTREHVSCSISHVLERRRIPKENCCYKAMSNSSRRRASIGLSSSVHKNHEGCNCVNLDIGSEHACVSLRN